MDFTMSYILCEVMTKKISELNYLENYIGSWYFSDSALQSPIARSSHCSPISTDSEYYARYHFGLASSSGPNSRAFPQ